MTPRRDQALDADLADAMLQLWRAGEPILTIADGRPNRIEGVDSSGVRLSTEASDSKGTGPQLVPAWMLNEAWAHLRNAGNLTNRYALAADGLNIKRSSAVCALLARVPGVRIASSRPVDSLRT